MKKLAAIVAIVCALCAAGFAANVFTVDKDFIYLNGKKFIVKGVNYGFGYPGEEEWEFYFKKPFPDNVALRIEQDIKDIKSLNMNTIRIWGAVPKVFEEIDKNGMYVYLTLWWEFGADDFYAPGFLEKQQGYIRDMIDKMHNLDGWDYSDNIVAYAVGNEIPEKVIRNNDRVNAGKIDEYKGEYISAPKGSTPTECFVAMLADFVKKYEKERYGETHLVTYSNMQPTEPILRTDFLDFLSLNAYSHSTWCFYRGKMGSVTGTDYQGYIEWFRNKFPDKPLVFSEFGLSTAPECRKDKQHPYGYGGNTEEEQARNMTEMWDDMMTASKPVAGGLIFAYQDYWAHGWSSEPKATDKMTHDPKDPEEWFGIVGQYGTSPEDYKIVKKKAFYAVRKMFSSSKP